MPSQTAPRHGRRSPLAFPCALVSVMLLILGLGLVGAPSAGAHAALRTSNPVDGSVVVNLPPNYELVFNETIDPNFAQIVIEDSAGQSRSDAEVSVRGTALHGPLPRDLPAGETTIRYRVVSADGHPVGGEVRFEFRPAQPPATPAPGATQAPGTAATDQAAPDQAAPQADAVASDGISNVTMLALGGLGILVFAAIALLLLRADRRGR
ncbi:hypothetical protein BJY21_003846 [Kineosphaera limosa]|uniref:Copper resistance protein C n=1 Tax=Kineosphaera limosa NBRC 100340 TaxID=1184609 RepID=K6X072_9MICO|nr:copper resistance CopC family protein [Kineosphaera limosa]NYE02662.1 hypothetical protein [Kineosphaera limosa]GAB97752.1 copper resistance protein C [Kineosphaera limosa NBRC 100340]